MSTSKSIVLKPEVRSWFWSLLLGILLVPLFGIGLVILWFVHKNRSSLQYEIHDRFIRVHQQEKAQTIDLADIEHVDVSQRWIDKKLNTGTLILSSTSFSVQLVGMDRPQQLADMIIHSARAERKRRDTSEKKEYTPPKHDPGTLDKMDYLTGIWHQGLISNEEYEKEKTYFESKTDKENP